MRKQQGSHAALSRKTIAVSSGKGGVGKTTTAVNLAIHYARINLRVGLIDLDPLSDVAALLDLEEPESVFTRTFDARNNDFSSHVLTVFDRLDLIFPSSKLQKQDSVALLEKLYVRFAAELDRSYDLLILDLPAGVRYEDNLVFLHHAGHLVVVTNAEPTAHVSAGGYIKGALSLAPGLAVHLWHNKFGRQPGQAFDPVDVVGNYNRNVGEEERIDEKLRGRIDDLAFIPADPALDLLQTHPSPRLNLLRSILDLCEFFRERRLSDLASGVTLSPKLFDIIKYFLLHTEKIQNVGDYLESFGDYLKNVIRQDSRFAARQTENEARLSRMQGLSLFTGQERSALEKYLTKVKVDEILLLCHRLIRLLEPAIGRETDARLRAAATGESADRRSLDAAIGRLLLALNTRKKQVGPDVVNAGGLLLFYFSLYKLFASRSVVGIILDFIPRRVNARGKTVRDKQRQIRDLVVKNGDYEARYFRLIKTLYPVVNRQVSTVVDTFKLNELLLKDRHGRINKLAYLTLFTTFMHETINSGLSVIVGFKHRPASREFVRAANALLGRVRAAGDPADADPGNRPAAAGY